MRLRSERLPWLPDEPPVTAPAAPKARSKPVGRAMWPWYLLLLLLSAAVVAVAWWLSTGKDAAPPVLPAEQSIPVPVTRQEAAPSPSLTADAEGALENAIAPAQDVPPAPAPAKQAQGSAAAKQRAQAAPAPARERTRRTRGASPAGEEPAEAPSVTGPTPAVLYHPNPNRGRVVQLGAFATRDQAEQSWRRITRRYPYLATKPKMVNTVDVRGLGGGRPTRMYRLQLGTSSQAQSVVICQQLERAGQSCVVVY